MAVSLRAAGTWVFNGPTNPRQVAIPAGFQAGDLGILICAWKPFGLGAIIDQGWTELFDVAAGSTANGVGVGSMRLYVAYKELGASETNPTITRQGGSPTPEMNVIIVLQKDASETWNIAQLSNAVEEAMAGTSFSHNLTTTDAIAVDDWVFALTGVADDSSTFTRSTTAISGGPSWNGNVVETVATHASTTAGNDGAADIIHRVASSAVASGQTITLTGTLSAAERVGSILFKVWVTSSGTQFTKDLGGATLSFSGSLAKQTNKPLAGVLSFTGAFTKQANKALAGGLSFAGTLSKSIFRSLTGSLSFSGALTTSRVFMKALTGTLSFSGSLAKQAGKSLTGGLSFSGAISKQANKALAGGLSFSGSVTKRTSKALTGALSFGGQLSKSTRKVLSGGLTFAGALSRSTQKSLTAALTFTGSLAKQTRKTLAGALSFAGNLTRDLIPTGTLYFKSFTASLSFSGSLTRTAILDPLRIAGSALEYTRNWISRSRRSGLRPRR